MGPVRDTPTADVEGRDPVSRYRGYSDNDGDQVHPPAEEGSGESVGGPSEKQS